MLSQLGLLSACGGDVGTKEEPESETPFDPGALAPVTGEGGYATGRSKYENEAFEFRTSAAVCSNVPVDDPRVASLEATDPCATGADCTEKEHGYCAISEGQIVASYCAYGCESDSDCAATELCECGPDVGVCRPAECRSSDDCDGARCLRIVEQDNCADGFGPRTYYKCESKADSCVADSDCSEPKVCLSGENGVRSCAERTLCGIGRPFLVENEARLADSVLRRDWVQSIKASPARLLEGLSPEKRERLADGWRQIARMEHASIAAFARFQLELLSLGAPADLVEATNQALVDETLHARTAFALTSLFSGKTEGPGPLEIRGALGGEGLEEIALSVLLEGCIGETAAALEANWAAAHCEDATLRELLSGIARDEKRHSDLAWQFVAWATEGRPHLASELLTRAFAESKNQRHIASLAVDDDWISAYGLVPERVRDELRAVALKDVVIPCLAALERRAA